ncbi:FLP 18 GPCR receptor [Meloidogyne graminicola]|uniref:FLP 18 GPCR receptor n=1 Tax=Meloidogyne graminicola TaxID=189291 RepID=A0A8S9ZMP5_9BILA|nr:FLP 18 GPCR receptor [Meloidogyne graminicola]
MEASTMDLHLTSDFLFNASSTTAQVVCEDMNVYLWNSRRDLTTRPLIMGVFASLYSTIIILSLVGNACVLVAISRIRSLQTVPNMFIFSLSCSDMLVCCISATITPIAAFRKDWIFGQFLCSFAPFLASVNLRVKKRHEWKLPISSQQNAATKRRQRTNRICLIGPRSNESSVSVSIEGKKEKTKHMMHNDDVGNNYHQQRLEKELMNDVYNESCYTEEEQTLIANLRIHFEDMNVIDNDNDTLDERDTDDRI